MAGLKARRAGACFTRWLPLVYIVVNGGMASRVVNLLLNFLFCHNYVLHNMIIMKYQAIITFC